MSGIRPGENDVLLVIDVQNDFCPGGALEVPRGDEVVPIVNRLARRFSNVVLTQDWHPPDHLSFASPIRAAGHSKWSRPPTAPRCCGPTIAFRAPWAPIFTRC